MSNNTTKRSRRKNLSKQAGRFHETKGSKDYYILTTIGMWLFTMIIFLLLDNKNPFKTHAIVFWIIFVFANVIAMFGGHYKKEEAHQFFTSYKAVDIYLHIIGLFAIYLIAFVYFPLSAFDTTVLSFGIGLLWEVVEFIIQTGVVLKDKNQKPEVSKYTFWLREEFGNIAQDILSNMVGILLAYLYVLWITASFLQ